MAQQIKVQDGNIIYAAAPDVSGNPQDVSVTMDGQLYITKNLLVGNDPLTPGVITTAAGQSLILTTGAGGNINLSPSNALILNGVQWPTGSLSVTAGSFLGASATDTLEFYPFVIAFNGSDTLTTSQLNTAYPTAQPGQSVIGPTVVYQCVSASTWRTLGNGSSGGSYTGGTGIDISGGVISNTGVLSFNTRTGAISLTSSDVTTALGYTPTHDHIFVATGTIASGAVVGLNLDGTVSVISSSAGIPGSTFVFSGADNADIVNAVYAVDTSMVVVAYNDSTAVGVYVAIGKVDPVTHIITFGTPVLVHVGTGYYIVPIYDDVHQRVVITWQAASEVNTPTYTIVGIVDAMTLSITFGTATLIPNGDIYNRANNLNGTCHSASGQIVITYTLSDGYAIVGTVDPTLLTITFGTPVIFNVGFTELSWSTSYDPIQQKVVILYSNAPAGPGQIKIIVGDVGAGTVTFGTPVMVAASSWSAPVGGSFIYNPLTASFLILFNTGIYPNAGQAVVGTVSGSGVSSTITLGTPATYTNSSVSWAFGAYDSSVDRILFTYCDYGNSNYGTAVSASMFGNEIAFSLPTVYNPAPTYLMVPVYDSVAQREVIIYTSGLGHAMIWGTSGTSNADAWIGLADTSALNGNSLPVAMIGDVSSTQVGLITGHTYYLNSNGSLGTTWTSYGIIGTAISSTELLITGKGSAGGLDTQIQFNNSGVLSGNVNLTVNKSTGQLITGVDASINGLTIGRGPTNDISCTAIGLDALQINTGLANTAVGINALQSGMGNNNVAVGSAALQHGASNGNDNVAIGVYAQGDGKGSDNISIGYQSLAFGYYDQCVGIGTSAIGSAFGQLYSGLLVPGQVYTILYPGTIDWVTEQGAADNNSNTTFTALIPGTYDGQGMASTSIGNGVAIGYKSQFKNNSGQYNTTIGANSSYNLLSGYNNTSLGYSTLNQNVGANNTAIGTNALNNVGTVVSSLTCVIGRTYQIVSIGTEDFTIMGASANAVGLIFTVTATGAGGGTVSPVTNNNVAIGYNSGIGLTNGNNNIIIGSSPGTNIDTLSNNVVISDGAGNERIWATSTGSVAIGSANPAEPELATTATDGFLYIPTCAGVPTGVPTAISGRAPLVMDSTPVTGGLYIYLAGAWVKLLT